MNTQWISHEEIGIERALDMTVMQQEGYSYIWYQELSRVGICSLADYHPDRDKVLEARIFTNAVEDKDASEVHVFADGDGQLKAVRTVVSKDAYHTDEQQLLLPMFGKSLTVRTVYTFDEDGQAVPGAFLLTGYNEGRN